MLGQVRNPESFLDALLTQLVRRARARVKPHVKSKTLRRGLETRIEHVEGRKVASVFLPYFWAVYNHEGRGPTGPKRSRYLLYFRNPKNDPRTDGGTNYPVRASQIRRLSKAQVNDGFSRNRALEKANPAGGPMQYMVFVKAVKKAKGDHFFDRGLRLFPAESAPYIRREFREWLLASLSKRKPRPARMRL